MTTHHTYLLSNLSANQFIEFQVAESDDVLSAARERLRASGLPEGIQGGFFLSVYPMGAESIQENLDEQPVYAEGESTPLAGASPSVGDTVASTSTGASTGATGGSGPLEAAAAQGSMDWPEDAEDEGRGSHRSEDTKDDSVPFVVVPLGVAGGH